MLCRLPLGLVPPFGYFICWCIEAAAIFCVFSTTIPLTCTFMGGCWLFYSIIKDISRDLSHLNPKPRSTTITTSSKLTSPSKIRSLSTSVITSTSSQSHPLNDRELKVQFCSIVKLYSELEELSLNNGIHFVNHK